MKKLLPIAGLSLAFVLPVIAAESVRFPPIPPERYSPQQKEFAELMRQPPRNGNVVNAPSRCISAVRNSDFMQSGCRIICVGARNLTQKQTELIILLLRANRTADISGMRITRWRPRRARPGNSRRDRRRQAAIRDERRPGPALRPDHRNLSRPCALGCDLRSGGKRFGEKGVTDAVGLAGYYGITAMALIVAKAT